MPESSVVVTVRDLEISDLDEVVRIDSAHTGAQQGRDWSAILDRYVGTPPDRRAFGLAVSRGKGLAAYLFGEVRAFEFGAEPAGWVFAVGVDPRWQRQGIARALLAEAHRRFDALGVRHVRTMVRRNDVSILSFFRAAGFVGGPFVQLDFDLETNA